MQRRNLALSGAILITVVAGCISDGGSIGVDDGGAESADRAAVDAGTLDMAAHDVTVPDTARPDAAQSDAAQVDAAQADSAQADAAQPDADQPDAAQSDAAQADAAQPDAAQPDAAQADAAQADAGEDSCPAAELGARLGSDRLFVGGAMDDLSFTLAPFDLRYQYVAGDVPADGPCASCASSCTVRGESCDNSSECAWWGCWQWDQLPPGRFVADFLTAQAAAGAVPMITTYIWYSVAGDVEGAAEMSALQDSARLGTYLADYRFLLQVMNEDPTITAMLHLEPDLWGYGHQIDDDPTQIPVALGAAGVPECSSMGDHLGGLARCMLAVARAEAPNVLVGFHASAWGAGHDALINPNASFDLAGHAAETAAYMRALGADAADFVVVEMSDRDAGYNDRWWDVTDQELPHFTQAISWVQALGEGLDLAPLWWQVPYGHMALENVCDRYQDNRVDYFFDHAQDFAAGGALGIAFGAGAGCQTTPATDDDSFVSRAQGFYGGERPRLCGQ